VNVIAPIKTVALPLYLRKAFGRLCDASPIRGVACAVCMKIH
jgi:hypothetical protein